MGCPRRDVRWDILGGRFLEPRPFLVAGIVNATPDSFYDGGRHDDAAAAVAWGRKLAADGADIVDVGGESTRPGAAAVDARTELGRVLPVVSALAADAAGPAVSVDTFKAPVADAALAAGAAIVNDVSACRVDPALADVLAQRRPGYVLMHSRGTPADMQTDPRYADVLADVLAFFEERLRFLTGRGLPESHIVLDPGIGFGKTLEHNLTLMRNIPRLAALGRPVYLGLSNKSWLGTLLGLELGQRGPATQAATALAAAAGARIHRVHDVAETVRTLRLVRELAPEPPRATGCATPAPDGAGPCPV